MMLKLKPAACTIVATIAHSPEQIELLSQAKTQDSWEHLRCNEGDSFELQQYLQTDGSSPEEYFAQEPGEGEEGASAGGRRGRNQNRWIFCRGKGTM